MSRARSNRAQEDLRINQVNSLSLRLSSKGGAVMEMHADHRRLHP